MGILIGILLSTAMTAYYLILERQYGMVIATLATLGGFTAGLVAGILHG